MLSRRAFESPLTRIQPILPVRHLFFQLFPQSGIMRLSCRVGNGVALLASSLGCLP